MNFCQRVREVALSAIILLVPQVSTPASPATLEHDGREILTVHAEGAQIYECKSDVGERSEGGALTWQFREPIATLILDGKSVGRHYAGPNWAHVDGSGVTGRVAASAPGATSNDIPWLKIDVIDHRNRGILSDAAIVQRINTKGGVKQGSCKRAGEYLSVPYSADYVFLRGGV